MGAQIDRWPCNAQENQKWYTTRDVNTGAIQIISAYAKKCWNNGGALAGGRLNLFACSELPAQNTSFYLEYQGLVPKCGGPANQKVRKSLSVAQKQFSYFDVGC
jgi:hypothetical protein